MRSLSLATLIALIAAVVSGFIALGDAGVLTYADYVFLGACAVFLILFVMLLAYKATRSIGEARRNR